MITGYCAITADILHYGHLHFLLQCRKRCDKLVVGIMTDRCVKEYKGEYPIMSEKERELIVKSLVMVSTTVLQDTFEFPDDICSGYDIVFDSNQHNRTGADVLIPYTEGISSTIIKEKIYERGKIDFVEPSKGVKNTVTASSGN